MHVMGLNPLPDIALHQWRPAPGLVTHVSYIGDFDGPRSFRKL
jgi:Icc protein